MSALPGVETPFPNYKLNYQVNEACRVLGISRSKLYEEIRAGRLVKSEFLGRTVIIRDDLERFWREHVKRCAA